MGAWKNAFFLQEKSHAHKFLGLGGGGILGFGGGGECRFYFYGRADFSDQTYSNHCAPLVAPLQLVGERFKGQQE